MTTFLSFLPIIIVAVFVAFAGILIIHHEKNDEEKLQHARRKHPH